MSEVKTIIFDKGEGDKYTVTTFLDSSAWNPNDGDVAFRFSNYQHPVEHIHKDFCEIYCVFSGEIINIVNGESVLMKPGDCCLILRDDKHALAFPNKKQKDCLFINFAIRWEYFLRLKYIFGERALPIFEEGVSKYFHLSEDKMTTLLNKAYFLQTPNDEFVPEVEFDCKCIIIDLLKQFAKQKQAFSGNKNIPEWLNGLLKSIQSISNMHKPLEELVAEVPYSYSYIAKEFKKYFDCSMVSYFVSVKMRYARELILNTDKKIIDISLMVGYSSLSHFTYIFKKEYGLSPSQLRNQKNTVKSKKYGKRTKKKEN